MNGTVDRILLDSVQLRGLYSPPRICCQAELGGSKNLLGRGGGGFNPANRPAIPTLEEGHRSQWGFT